MPPDLSSPFPTCPDKKKEKKEIVECREICKDNSQMRFDFRILVLSGVFLENLFSKVLVVGLSLIKLNIRYKSDTNGFTS